MPIRIGCVVEGQGEEHAVPIIVRRIAGLLNPSMVVQVPTVIRRPRGRLVKQPELEAAVDLAARRLGGRGAILVILDGDADCPAQLGPKLLGWAQAARTDLPAAVVVAKREFEAWFIAAAESLRGQQGLATDLRGPPDPENVRGAKEWLARHMPREQPYSPTAHQALLARQLDLDAARRRADSFDKCYREVVRLLTDPRVATP